MTDPSNAIAKESENTLLLHAPSAIAEYIVHIALADRSAAYLQVTAAGHLVGSGGCLQKYELAAIAEGDYVGETFYYLEGFFPVERTEVMQHLQLDCGPVVDVHVIDSDEEGAGWVLILDTTAEAQRAQRLQQKGNDLSLLRQQYAKLLNNSLTLIQQQKKAIGEIVSQSTEQHRTVSVLIVKFCGPQANRLGVGKPSTLKAVNASLSYITQVIVEEGGLLNHVIGGTAAAFFGLLPSQQSAPQQAVGAAERVIKRLLEHQPHYALEPIGAEDLAAEGEVADKQSKRLGVGASITSGIAAAGILHGQGGERINAVGDPIQSAAQMGRYIQPGTITIDRHTFEIVNASSSKKLGQSLDQFRALQVSALRDSELPSETTLYRLKVEPTQT